MKQLFFLFLVGILSFAASAQGLIKHTATIQTNEVVELRSGDDYKSKFELSGVFGYNGKLNLTIRHYVLSDVDENGNDVWSEYRTTQSYDQAVSLSDLNSAWNTFSGLGLITISNNPKQQYELALAHYIFNLMSTNESYWYNGMSLSDVTITVSE